MPHQHEGECHPKHGVENSGNGRDPERQDEGANRFRRNQGCRERPESSSQGPRYEGHRRHQDHESKPTENGGRRGSQVGQIVTR